MIIAISPVDELVKTAKVVSWTYRTLNKRGAPARLEKTLISLSVASALLGEDLLSVEERKHLLLWGTQIKETHDKIVNQPHGNVVQWAKRTYKAYVLSGIVTEFSTQVQIKSKGAKVNKEFQETANKIDAKKRQEELVEQIMANKQTKKLVLKLEPSEFSKLADILKAHEIFHSADASETPAINAATSDASTVDTGNFPEELGDDFEGPEGVLTVYFDVEEPDDVDV
ncbi:hypothetical protein C8R43DRAFT_1128758 [Mycena crocata]|nr:hypothetical protein C8R43DRAFT_1128758 [Mycena crocata]